MRLTCLVIAFALVASPVLAQAREPAQRQVILDLAYVLGEAHALRQLCAGPGDQFWRTRMIKLLEAETADRVFEERLRETFNTGYVARQAQHIQCSAQSRDAETRVAARGQALARRMIVEPPSPPQPDSLAPY